MPRGRKPRQSSASNEFAVALEHLKKGFELLISAAQAKEPSTARAKKAGNGKAQRPGSDEPAYEIYQLLEKSKRPVTPEALAKKTGKSLSSIRLYLSKYSCFENVWGKGYKIK